MVYDFEFLAATELGQLVEFLSGFVEQDVAIVRAALGVDGGAGARVGGNCGSKQDSHCCESKIHCFFPSPGTSAALAWFLEFTRCLRLKTFLRRGAWVPMVLVAI